VRGGRLSGGWADLGRTAGAGLVLVAVGLLIVLLFIVARQLTGFLFSEDREDAVPGPVITVPPVIDPVFIPPVPSPGGSRPQQFPDAKNSGVPDGYPLKKLVPDTEFIVDRDIDGVEIAGMIVIGAPDVTISNSRIWATTELFGVWNREGFPGAAVKNVEIICVDGPKIAAAGVAGVQRVEGSDISGCADGIKIGGGARIVGNYIHDLAQKPGLHNDGIQMQGGSDVLIARNTIVTVDKGGSTANAAVFIQSESAPIDNVSIVGNFVDGFGFSLRLNGDRVTGSEIVDNVIGTRHLFGPTLLANGAEASRANNREKGNIRPDGTPIE